MIRRTSTLHFNIFPLGIMLYVNYANLGKVQLISYITVAVCILIVSVVKVYVLINITHHMRYVVVTRAW